MATHTHILAWKISWTEEPGGLQSMGSHDWTTNTYLCIIYSQHKNMPLNMHSICQQIWKTRQWPWDWKRSVFIPIVLLKNWCFWTVVLEKTLESPLDYKEIQPVHPKGNQSWIFIGRTDVEAETPILWPPDCKKLTHLERPWCWERLKAGGEGDDRGWDGWMASPTRQAWVWVNSRSWWWTGKPGMLQSMGSQRVGHRAT